MAIAVVTAKVIPADGSEPRAVTINMFEKLKLTPGYLQHVAGRAGHDITLEEAKTVLDAPLKLKIQPNGRWKISGGPIRNKYVSIVIVPDVSAGTTLARLWTAYADSSVKP